MKFYLIYHDKMLYNYHPAANARGIAITQKYCSILLDIYADQCHLQNGKN